MSDTLEGSIYLDVIRMHCQKCADLAYKLAIKEKEASTLMEYLEIKSKLLSQLMLLMGYVGPESGVVDVFKGYIASFTSIFGFTGSLDELVRELVNKYNNSSTNIKVPIIDDKQFEELDEQCRFILDIKNTLNLPQSTSLDTVVTAVKTLVEFKSTLVGDDCDSCNGDCKLGV